MYSTLFDAYFASRTLESVNESYIDVLKRQIVQGLLKDYPQIEKETLIAYVDAYFETR